MQRLMLTPLYRNLLRFGLPFAICFGTATLYLADTERRTAVICVNNSRPGPNSWSI
jgi:cell division protein FtsQ